MGSSNKYILGLQILGGLVVHHVMLISKLLWVQAYVHLPLFVTALDCWLEELHEFLIFTSEVQKLYSNV